MLTLLNSDQTKLADEFTILKRFMLPIDLMEKASRAFVNIFKARFKNKDMKISIYCGTGNNGGDGLAIARLLKDDAYENISLKLLLFTGDPCANFSSNMKRLPSTGIDITEIADNSEFHEESADVLIDAILGSGLNRPVSGYLFRLINHLNDLGKITVAVDVPTGFPSEGKINLKDGILKADLTISFQRPKINFFFPESAGFLREFAVADIGLDENFIQSQPGDWLLIEESDVCNILKVRENFSHKGSYGHALIISGSTETMGAALLCADACLHSGAGLTTACIPTSGLTALNTRSPEIMAITRDSQTPGLIDFEKYQAIAIGPGLGTEKAAETLLWLVLKNFKSPLVIDADGLNILAKNPECLMSVPKNSILTPHVKEFDRLFGEHGTWWERLETARKKAAELQLIILLKNRYSFIVLPTGEIWINITGNPAMASGGSGDVLTGMIAAFLTQGYKPEEAATLGCYLHGKCGDVLHQKSGMHCIPPRYLVKIIPKVINAKMKEKASRQV